MKRKQEEITDVRGGEEAAASLPRKKARKFVLRTLYTVTRTDYKDDYKTRGDDWSDTSTLGTFVSKSRANKHKELELFGIVREKLEERGSENKRYAQYWTKDAETEELELDAARIWRDLDDLVERFSEGEFVPRRFSVDIETTNFDDRSSSEEVEAEDEEQ